MAGKVSIVVDGPPSAPSAELIAKLRSIVKNFVHSQDYESAAFWAEKVLFLTNDPEDAYERARCLYSLKQYHRAAHTIITRKLHLTNLSCLYLAAKCYHMERDFKEATQLLDSSPLILAATSAHNDTSTHTTTIGASATPTSSFAGRHSSRLTNQSNTSNNHHHQAQPSTRSSRNSQSNNNNSNTCNPRNQTLLPISNHTTSSNLQFHVNTQNFLSDGSSQESVNRWLGAVCLLKGKLYESSDNRQMAQVCFKEALLHDIFCFEAFTSLTKHHMLTVEEENDLLNELNIEGTLAHDPEMGQFVKLFYHLQGKKYHKPTKSILPAQLGCMSTNVDVETSLAERYYFNCDYHSAYELSQSILQKDVHHLDCLPIYILSLMEIERPTQLFDIAHQLVDLYPDNAISWFAVGCYYLVINKMEPARRYLSKATTLDSVFGPAWLVYGYSFAVEREHDQAMAAYFRAYHLMRGCHLPLLFIGVEYGRANDCQLAEKFLLQAKSIAPEDPFVLHEYGVIHYRNKSYKAALECFTEAEKIIKQASSTLKINRTDSDRFKQKWEPLMNNIGHTLRQQGQYHKAIEYHNRALSLVRENSSTYSALGFLYYLLEDWDQAFEHLNSALSIRYNDSISSSLLEKTIPKSNRAHLKTLVRLDDIIATNMSKDVDMSVG